MCTLVMKRDKISDMLVAAKTVDTPKTLLTFNRKLRSSTTYEYIFFKMGWQKGINSGINEEGLTILSSFASTTLQEFKTNLQDTRGIANEYILSHYSYVNDALEELEVFFSKQPSDVGGIHFLMDATGSMGILEHEPTNKVKTQMVELDCAVRANGPLLLQNTKERLLLDWEDRRLRYDQAKSGLINVTGESWLDSMKELLSSHFSKDQLQTGQLCIHDFENTGSRSKDLTTHCTETALIFDVNRKKLIYSDGSPCKGHWLELKI
ncbi:hypothetical protein [Mesobacillus maritimus]|uniref:hypothetical protein n=1 Tax=Mesobacillus maritimus TaxID=1643336 RepID=UPI00384C3CB6